MKRKLMEMVTRSLALVLSLCVVSGAWATDYSWTGGGDGKTWTNPENWGEAENYPSEITDTATFTTAVTVEGVPMMSAIGGLSAPKGTVLKMDTASAEQSTELFSVVGDASVVYVASSVSTHKIFGAYDSSLNKTVWRLGKWETSYTKDFEDDNYGGNCAVGAPAYSSTFDTTNIETFEGATTGYDLSHPSRSVDNSANTAVLSTGTSSQYLELTAPKGKTYYGTTYTFDSPVSSATDYILEFDATSQGAYAGLGNYMRIVDTQGNDLVVSYANKKDSPKGAPSGKGTIRTGFSLAATTDTTRNDMFEDRGATSLSGSTRWYHYVFKGNMADGLWLQITRKDGTVIFSDQKIGDFAQISKIYFFTQNNQGYAGYRHALDDIRLQTVVLAAMPDAPSFTASASEADIRKIELTSSIGATIWYRIGGEELDETGYAVYEKPLELRTLSKVYAYATLGTVKSTLVSQTFNACDIAMPTAAVTGIDGVKRTVTITSDYNIVVSNTGNADSFVESEKTITVESATKYYIRAYLDSETVPGERIFSTGMFELDVNAGENYKLGEPSCIARGLNYVLIDASSSMTIGNLKPTIHYSIGGVETTVSDETQYITQLPEGEELTCWTSYEGCEQSDSVSYAATVVPSSYVTIATYDYYSEFKSGGNTSYGTETYKSSITGSEVDYYSLYKGSVSLYNPLWYTQTLNGSNPRWQNAYDGLWQNDSGRKALLFASLPSGSLIYVNSQQGMDGNGGVTTCNNLNDVSSTYVSGRGLENVYEVSSSGDCLLNIYRYTSIYSIRIAVPAVASADGTAYTTLQAAADNAAEGVAITLKSSTTDGVTLKRGQQLVLGDFTCGEVTGASNFITVVYDEVSKTYTAVENAAWNGGAGSWDVKSNWNTGVVPSRYTAVTIDNGENDYVNVYLESAAACASLAVNGKVYFSQKDAAINVHNEISLYGNVTGSGTVKFNHSGFHNKSGSAITIAPAIEIAHATENADSWLNGAAIALNGKVSIGGVFRCWSGTPVTFNNDIEISADGESLQCYGDVGFVFNNVKVTATGNDVQIYVGNKGPNSPITGAGMTVEGSVKINTLGGATKITAPVKLEQNASLTVVTGDNGSVASVDPVIATCLISETTGTGTKTYTASLASWAVNGQGYATLAEAWSAAGKDEYAAWITLLGTLEANDTVTMDTLWQKLRVAGADSADISANIAITPNANLQLKREVKEGFVEYVAYPATLVLTLPPVEHASATVTANGEAATPGAIPYGAAVVVTWTADDGYAITANAKQEIASMTKAVTANAPTVAAVTVTLGKPSVTYGDDYEKATVQATVSGENTQGVTYELTVTKGDKSKTYTGGKVANETVTFENVEIPRTTDNIYADITYTVTPKSGSTALKPAATTEAPMEKTAWGFESKVDNSAVSSTGGSWGETTPAVKENKLSFTDGGTFTANSASSDDIVVITMDDICFGDVNAEDVQGTAQAGVRIGQSSAGYTFQVYTANNTWLDAAGSVTVDPAASYNVVVTINYSTDKYSVAVDGTLLTAGSSTSFALAGTPKSVSAVEFCGEGSLASIEGEAFDGNMVVDEDGNKFATIEAAIAALKAGTATAPLRLLHDGTAPQGWAIEDGKLVEKPEGIVVEEPTTTATEVTSIIAVPQSSTTLTAATLINTANRNGVEETLTLKVYNKKTKDYNSWKFMDSEWVDVTVYKATPTETTELPTTSADSVTLEAGDAVWVTYNPKTPLVLNGEYATAAVQKTLAAGYNLVAPLPRAGETAIDLNSADIFKEPTKAGDRIIIPTSGAPYNCQYKDGKWKTLEVVVDDSGMANVKWVDAPTVKPGTGFWYYSESGSTVDL